MIGNLRNVEYYQFMVSAQQIFNKFNIKQDVLGALYDELAALVEQMEQALAFEKRNEKIREKNDMDNYRDRMHRKLFNQLKSILYDDRDPRFDGAQAVMRIVKDVGNPTRLPENVQSAVMTTLGNRLEPLRKEMEAIGVDCIVDEMMNANRQFIALEIEAREITAAFILSDTPVMGNIRKEATPVYRNIVAAISAHARLPHKAAEYREMVTEMNVLVARYDALLAARKRSSS